MSVDVTESERIFAVTCVFIISMRWREVWSRARAPGREERERELGASVLLTDIKGRLPITERRADV